MIHSEGGNKLMQLKDLSQYKVKKKQKVKS